MLVGGNVFVACGVLVGVAVEVGVDVEVKVGVGVGPNICPVPHPEMSRLSPKVYITIILVLLLINLFLCHDHVWRFDFLRLLELISKIVFDKNNNTSQLNESEVILKKTIIANQNAAVVLQPSKQALHFPSPAIAA